MNSPETLILCCCFAVAGMVTLQNLQNLANLQNLPQVASFAAGLQGMSSELTNNQLINAPLNLTVTPPGEFHSRVTSRWLLESQYTKILFRNND